MPSGSAARPGRDRAGRPRGTGRERIVGPGPIPTRATHTPEQQAKSRGVPFPRPRTSSPQELVQGREDLGEDVRTHVPIRPPMRAGPRPASGKPGRQRAGQAVLGAGLDEDGPREAERRGRRGQRDDEDDGQEPREGMVLDDDRGPATALLVAGAGRELDPMDLADGRALSPLPFVDLRPGLVTGPFPGVELGCAIRAAARDRG